ncbi:MAG: UDP-N-acetyl glucosamine 2-epimerase [Candidatus Nanosyncoccaceae bacterium]|jgi:UDP-N-acetylglucosamine 2-epimerase (non-hydrolysing)
MSVAACINQKLLDKISKSRVVHIITIGTKPDIIKQAPLYHELKKRGQVVLICHTEQHYDFAYSGGVEKEFNLDIDFRLGVSGSLQEKTVQIIDRVGDVIEFLQSQNKTIIPYVHGDTSTASSVAIASFLHRVACVHVEAGIRTLTPKKSVYQKHYRLFKEGKFNWNNYYKDVKNPKNLTKGSMEPFPEQVNTRICEPASGFYAAPTAEAKQNLIDEGYEKSKISLTGNTIADSTLLAVSEAEKSKVFEKYPMLKGQDYILFTFHRRENTSDKKRFRVIMNAAEKLVKEGYLVVFISLLGTEAAIDRFEFRERVDKLREKYPNFVYTHAWAYHRDMIAGMLKASVVVTDSGGMQEETNIIKTPCVTLRFGSDRGESFIAGSNIPAPPISSNLVVEIIKGAINNNQMCTGNIYGKNVSHKIATQVLKRVDEINGLYMTEEKRLGF